MKQELSQLKQEMIAEIEQRLQNKVLERSNAELLQKLITQADSEDDIIVNKRGLSAELRGALIEAKESIEGKRKLNTLDNLIVELKKGSKL